MSTTFPRSCIVSVAGVLSALCCGLSAPAGAAGASGGGTAPGAPSRPAVAKRAAPSAHVTSIRITSVRCFPSTHCSANPHQVSVRGILVLEIGRAHV